MRTLVARDITAGWTWFRRADGEMNAIVAPGFNAGGVVDDIVYDIVCGLLCVSLGEDVWCLAE